MKKRVDIEKILSSLSEFKNKIDYDVAVEEVKNCPRIILKKIVESIYNKNEEDTKKYLRSYRKISEGFEEGLNFVNTNLDADYTCLREIFRDLRKQGYFAFNGECSEKKEEK